MKPKDCLCTFYLAYHKDVPENVSFRQAHSVGCQGTSSHTLSVTTQGGHSYFITFTDDFSRYGYVYLLRHKSEAFGKFREFQNEVENQLERKIKALRSDRGGEYLSAGFQRYLIDQGILSECI